MPALGEPLHEGVARDPVAPQNGVPQQNGVAHAAAGIANLHCTQMHTSAGSQHHG